MYSVYALYSLNFKKIYIGYTSDLEKRLIAHNHLSNKGWTKKFQPWILIYEEKIEIKKDAMMREKQLKSAKGREFLKNYIPNIR